MSNKIRRHWSATHVIEGDRCEFRRHRACSHVAEFNLTTSDGHVMGVCPGHLAVALPIRVVSQKTPVLVSTRSHALIKVAL